METRRHTLADLLGDDHDLANLTRTVVDHREDWKLHDFAVVLAVAAQKHRARLQGRAVPLGRQLFEQSSEGFLQHLQKRK